MTKVRVIFYTKENCLLCEEAYNLLESLQSVYNFEIEIRDIYSNDEWLEEYQIIIPVIQVNEEKLIGNDIQIEKLMELFEKNL